MVEAKLSMNFGISVFVSQKEFQFKLLLTITSVMLRNSQFGLKFPTLTLAQMIIFLWKLMNNFLLRKLFGGVIFFFSAQINPKQLGFVASDLVYAGCSPGGGMHFFYHLKKFHFTIAN